MNRCPVCGSLEVQDRIELKTTLEVQEVTGVERFTYLVCACGMFYSDVPLGFWEKFYRRDYRLSRRFRDENVSSLNIKEETERADEIVKFVKKHIEPPGDCLDFGSSTGTLLQKLKDAFRCCVTGVELSDSFREYSINRGIRTVENLNNLTGERFDLITIVHVLEHIPDPLPLLMRLREKLDGYLLIQVPYLSLGFAHPLAFMEETITNLVERAGFHILHFEKQKDMSILCRKD